MNKIITKIVIVAMIVGGAGFYGGTLYGKNSSANSRTGNRQGAGLGANAGNFRGQNADRGFVSGEIMSKDDKSITVKLQTGGSKIVLYSGTTKIMKSVDGTTSDLTNGEQITVTGAQNQDGSVTAQSIQLRPTPQNNQ